MQPELCMVAWEGNGQGEGGMWRKEEGTWRFVRLILFVLLVTPACRQGFSLWGIQIWCLPLVVIPVGHALTEHGQS